MPEDDRPAVTQTTLSPPGLHLDGAVGHDHVDVPLGAGDAVAAQQGGITRGAHDSCGLAAAGLPAALATGVGASMAKLSRLAAVNVVVRTSLFLRRWNAGPRYDSRPEEKVVAFEVC